MPSNKVRTRFAPSPTGYHHAKQADLKELPLNQKL